ncbi:MAG: SIMPL domain-containing protein [bacterium]|nr:SIMPL domain-containing protein [bacterium]
MRYRNVLIAAGMAALLGVGCQADTILRTESGADDRVSVSGSASLEATPDVATTTLGVQTFEADAVAAVTANNGRTAAVINALRGLGVRESDMQTSGFSIAPQRAYSEDRPDSITGFWVRNTIAATVRDLAIVGSILQEAINAGANEIHGLQFTLSNPDSLEDIVRVLAVEDAHHRAEALAEAAGARLGRIISLNESSASVPYYFRGALESDAAGVPVEPGEVEVSASVSAVYALE